MWNALSHIFPDIWQPSDKAAIKNWKTPRMKPSPWKFYTVNKIDIKGLYVNVYIWPGLLCHVASVSVKVHMGLHFLTSPRSSMLSSSTCRVRELVKKSFDNGSSGRSDRWDLGCLLTSGHFSWMTSMMSSVKSPWMMISSSAVTEAPQENFWAKNLWASLRSMSDVDHRITSYRRVQTHDKHLILITTITALPKVAIPHTLVTYFFLALGIFAIVIFWGTVFFFCLIWPLPPAKGTKKKKKTDFNS